MDREDPAVEVVGNEDNLAQMLRFLRGLISARLSGADPADVEAWPKLGYFNDGSVLAEFIREREPSFDEYATLALALAPHLDTGLLEDAICGQLKKEGDFPELGAVRDPETRGLVPTGQTAAYLLAGADLGDRFRVQRLFAPDHWFAREGILRLDSVRDGAPALSGRLIMSRDWAERLTVGHLGAPAFSAAFPARKIETGLDWDDLILPPAVQEQLEELLRWTRHYKRLAQEWGFGGRLRPGYRALFHGASGTGKTLAATLLGKSTGHDVYRVDLSVVVSKYIGETEKNLSSLFGIAHQRDWILFFDEADALFGKRTAVKDSHDRYANQEVSYLLQRVEEYDGLCILGSNLRANIDDAFLRRFNAIVRFPEPGPEERYRIWRRALPARSDEAAREVLLQTVKDYDLNGGGIINVAHFAAIEALAAGRDDVTLADLELGIRREVEKEGKTFRRLGSVAQRG